MEKASQIWVQIVAQHIQTDTSSNSRFLICKIKGHFPFGTAVSLARGEHPRRALLLGLWLSAVCLQEELVEDLT